MTTKTAPKASEAAPATHKQGADLLTHLLFQIGEVGYRKIAVDTWRNDETRHNIRHAYSGGEWTLTSWLDGGGAHQVRWTVRATLPDARTLFNATMPPPF